MKLATYLETEQITDANFAAMIGRAQSSVTRLRNGKTLPDWETVARIADATNGAVTANDFMPDAPAPLAHAHESANAEGA